MRYPKRSEGSLFSSHPTRMIHSEASKATRGLSLRTRPMVCFVNELSVERIIYAIFHRFNEQWKNRTLRLFTQAA